MNTKEEFKQKMDAEVARAQAELERYTALGMGFTAEAKNKHDEHVEELERQIDETKTRLRELGNAEDHVWEELRDGVMSSWGALQSALQNAIETFKAEPPVAGLHGNDEGDYPYGEGLSGRPVRKK